MSAMRSMPADAGLLSLQQEALQRVRQMQQRARFAVEGGPGGNTPPPSAQAAPASASFSQQGESSQPPGAAPASASFSQQGESSRPPGAAPPNPSMPGGDAQRSGPRQGFRPPGPPPPAGQKPQRPSGAENILSQLFGGGARQQSRGQAPGSPPAPGKQSGANGLLDLSRGGLGGGEAAGLGDSLRGSIASASKPLSDLLDAFSIDGEKLLILLVMWVIFNELSDNKTLLLALGYLLL